MNLILQVIPKHPAEAIMTDLDFSVFPQQLLGNTKHTLDRSDDEEAAA